MSEIPPLGGRLEGPSPADTEQATSAPEGRLNARLLLLWSATQQTWLLIVTCFADEGLADASALSRAG